MVFRVFVEKKSAYNISASKLRKELVSLLGATNLIGLRIINRYDVEGLEEDLFQQCIPLVFSEPPLDTVYTEMPEEGSVFAVEYLPGQFDQRAESAAECIQLISQGERPLVQSATVYILEGEITPQEREEIKKYVINPVEAREAALTTKDTLQTSHAEPPKVAILNGFIDVKQVAMKEYIEEYSLAMDEDDLVFCQEYFTKENRNPTITELRLIDTYWSDHCRHTTFGTVLEQIDIQDEQVKKSYELYLQLRKQLYANRPEKQQTLMDMGTIGAKALRAKGLLQDLDESEEINACSVNIEVDNDGTLEDWLLLFKNETHNHPTEIEPFGGAATCIGGAIRDPLANRGYVYQAMRVTGAGDPLAPAADTIQGKLPQRKLVTTAADGYSSYGNQIGLATGQVTEIYHPGYVAKRMEIGAVVGAVPLANVRRETPEAGDVVILLGGRTGRDGCGGATGSSKAHDIESLECCGAEVQKGNPPIERRLQRLFRNGQATRLIRRCNDFGAGGVAVAIGELADGLQINLDAVPKKYNGLDGTELAISESQERMAVVVEEKDAQAFIALAAQENLEATIVASVTEEPRLVMEWRGETIVNIGREFLNSNGAAKKTNVTVPPLPSFYIQKQVYNGLQQSFEALVTDLNVCSQKGLAERFDSTIGAATVLMPFGGKHQQTPEQAMVAKLPVDGETTTCSGMAFGFDPYVSERNPYEGAKLAVVESIAKLVAAGFSKKDMYLSFQEYFERLRQDPVRWGKPFASLLGALQAQITLEVAAVGGKDSMSGSFEKRDVPPTLVSFAVASGKTDNCISAEFKLPGSKVVWLQPKQIAGIPCLDSFNETVAMVEQLIQSKKVLAAYTPGRGGVAEALFKMGIGNRLGFVLQPQIEWKSLFEPAFGSFVLELEENLEIGTYLGETSAEFMFASGTETVDWKVLQQKWAEVLEPVFPYQAPTSNEKIAKVSFALPGKNSKGPAIKTAKPRVLVPVFPGTNCEYDTARALRSAGAEPLVYVIRNMSPQAICESAAELARLIKKSQIVVLPGGFSGGDEPEGSAKLIASFLRGPVVSNAITELLEQRDGLMLGICNGFQALIKLGLVPFGEIRQATPESPTLTFNKIGRHQSMLVRTRVASNLSPWLMHHTVGTVHTVPISHGEGRFVATQEVLEKLLQNGQIATQYVNFQGEPSMELEHNPNGGLLAIEGITSLDGRIFGKMGHTERIGNHVYRNVPANYDTQLFQSGVDYFKL